MYPNIDTVIQPFGTDQKISTVNIMLEDNQSIWENHEGAGQAKELV